MNIASPVSKLRAQAFTLIELLVIITIIVVLLALLVPALDKAVYQAELAVCSARQSALARQIVLYSMDFRRAYPRSATPRQGAHHNLVLSLDQDFRPVLEPYFRINAMFNCPLNEEVDLEGSTFGAAQAASPLKAIFTDYSYFFAWQWTRFGSLEEGMFKMGDRFTWTDSQRTSWRFSILVSDFIEESPASPFVFSTHPDRAGMLAPTVLQDASPPWDGGAVQEVTLSWWTRLDSIERGPVDRNFAYEDGSVLRFSGQQWGNGQQGPGDDRFITVPQVASGDHINARYPTRRIYLPKP